MKCYFACNKGINESQEYLDMLEVTLNTAKVNTTLSLHFIYNGSETDKAYEIMQKYGVNVIFHQLTFEKELKELYTPEYIKSRLGFAVDLGFIIGTFSRIDIPVIETEDEYVLICGLDVMFLQDIKQETLPNPKYCAAAPDIAQDFNLASLGYKFFNADIMYINVKHMREKREQIIEMLKNKQPSKIDCFDQGYLNHVCENDFDELAMEYNWKPYWGYNKNAKIVHLHLIKPGETYSDTPFIKNVLKTFPDCIKGCLYYYQLFFEFLGKRSYLWIAERINSMVNTKIEAKTEDEIKRLRDKARGKQRQIMIVGGVFVFLLCLAWYFK